MCKIKVPKADICFWTGFYNDEDIVSWASNKAYLDMNRTMTFEEDTKNLTQKQKIDIYKKRMGWRDQGTEAICKNILASDKPFEDWHKEVCDKLIEIYGNGKLVIREGQKRTNKLTKLTYGQAQKWLNMTLKYLWLLNRLELIEDKEIRSWINKYEKNNLDLARIYFIAQRLYASSKGRRWSDRRSNGPREHIGSSNG